MDSEHDLHSTGAPCAESQYKSDSSSLLTDNEAVTELDPEVTTEDEDDDGIPYDGGWGWMITFGVFVNYVLLLGYIKSSGLFFVELLDKFQAPASHTALLFSVRWGVYSLSGFLVMNFCLEWCGSRKLVLIGGSCMALSAILSSLANQLTLLICLQSVLLAIGQAMLICPGQVLVGRYFKKRRKLALAFTECGVSIGNLVIPPLISYFFEQYALQGTLLLYGGLCLNSLPAAMLHRPLSYYTKRRSRKHLRLKQKNIFTDDRHLKLDKVSDTDVKDASRTECSLSELEKSESVKFLAQTQHVLKHEESGVSCELIKIDHKVTLGNKHCSQVSENPSKLSKCVSSFNLRSVCVVLDFSLLKSPMFCLFIVYSAVISCLFIPVDYLPALVSQHGVTESQAALLLSVIGGLDLVCRVTCAVIVGSSRVRVSTITASTSIVLAILMQCVAFMKTFEHFMVLAVILGLLGNVGNCMFTLLVIEMLGLDMMGKALGWGQLASGITMPALYPLLGYIRDTTGSYAIVYHVTGGAIMLTAILLLCIRPVRRWEKRRQNASNQSKVSRHDKLPS